MVVTLVVDGTVPLSKKLKSISEKMKPKLASLTFRNSMANATNGTCKVGLCVATWCVLPAKAPFPFVPKSKVGSAVTRCLHMIVIRRGSLHVKAGLGKSESRCDIGTEINAEGEDRAYREKGNTRDGGKGKQEAYSNHHSDKNCIGDSRFKDPYI